VNRPVFRALKIHVAGAIVTASQLRDESTEDGHRAAFDGVLFHAQQCARILDDVADVDTVAAAQRDLDTLRLHAAVNPTLGTWTNGTSTVTATLDPTIDAEHGQLVRCQNSAGERWTVTADEWLSRLDAMRAAGWTKGGAS